MAIVKGMGACLIAKDSGLPCAGQIQEGEAIGTVIAPGGPLIGHKRCADEWHARKAKAEREKRTAMVQRITQAGPGGPVDPRSAKDELAFGSVPLEKTPGKPYEKPANPISAPGNVEGAVAFIGDVPEDASPDEAVALTVSGAPVGGESIPAGLPPRTSLPDPTLTQTLPQGMWSAEELAEIEATRQKLLARRTEQGHRAAHTMAIDLSNLPPGTRLLSLLLDLDQLR